MFNRDIACCKCDTTFHVKLAKIYKTPALPKAIFIGSADKRGTWLVIEGIGYCGPCAGKAFPKIVDNDVVFKQIGAMCSGPRDMISSPRQ